MYNIRLIVCRWVDDHSTLSNYQYFKASDPLAQASILFHAYALRGWNYHSFAANGANQRIHITFASKYITGNALLRIIRKGGGYA